jgi:hypothetical protein
MSDLLYESMSMSCRFRETIQVLFENSVVADS